MGEVYRAHDTRLQRDVAVKILPADSADDPERVRRFEKEARAVSALNHPNILTVHDFGADSGIQYIVSELLEGESLRKLLAQGPLSRRQILDIAVQIADGLMAAHHAGIVHRDLKPENIMISRDNRVKILDFGLAKPVKSTSEDAQTLDTATTQPGLILGTVAYMSPEQARGATVDFRADQFALGLILYELATGRQAFHRDSPLHTLSAILTEEAPPVTGVPAPLAWIIQRCLSKDPAQRYGDTGDLYRDLRDLRDHISSGYASGAVKIASSKRTVFRKYAGLALIVFAAFIGGYLLAFAFAGSGEAKLSGYRFTPVATDAGLEIFPASSPNKKSIAYSAESNGVFQIFTKGLGSSAMATAITKSPADCFFPFWSPDGTHIFYIAGWNNQPGLWSVAAVGGSPLKLMDNVAQAAISPDGKILAFLRNDVASGQSYSLYISSPVGAPPKKYAQEPFASKRYLSWSYLHFSPDGSKLGVWASLWDGRSEFWILPFPEGKPKQALGALPTTPLARQFSWMPDSRRVVFGERLGFSLGAHLWMAGTEDDRIHPLTVGIGSEQSPSVAKDGEAVAFASMEFGYDLVEIPLNGSGMHSVETTHLTEVSPAWSPTGSQYAYVTDRGGSPEIWLKNKQDGWERPLVTQKDFGDDNTSFLLDVSFSPDGQRLAYRRAGRDAEAIWISTVTGNPPVRVAKEPQGQFERGPTWSPDGNWIAYFSIRDGKYALLKVRIGGVDAPVALKEDAGTYPRWSPQGDWIACLGVKGGIVLASPDGARMRTVGTGTWLAHGWSKDGSTLFGVRSTEDRRLVLAAVDVQRGTERVVGDLGPYPAAFSYGMVMGAMPLRGFNPAPDGQSFATSIIRPRADIWLLEGFEKKSLLR
jgi:serine/threonine protein kinase/Tol biopolymer transport system component